MTDTLDRRIGEVTTGRVTMSTAELVGFLSAAVLPPGTIPSPALIEWVTALHTADPTTARDWYANVWAVCPPRDRPALVHLAVSIPGLDTHMMKEGNA